MGIPESDECRGGRDVLDRVGDKWSLLLIAHLGTDTKRFGELKRGISGISQRMLTVTLRNLERDGILVRKIYPEIPPRVEYTLTSLGETLLVAVRPLMQWAEDNADVIAKARDEYDGREAVTAVDGQSARRAVERRTTSSGR